MSQIFKSLFSTSAPVHAAERIARTYKTKIISFLDKSHQNPADWQRIITYVDLKEPELNKEKYVEIMARGAFHDRRPTDRPEDGPRLTLWLLNALGIPIKSVHVNEDGTEHSIRDIPESEQRIKAAKIAASKKAAAKSLAAQAAAGKAGGSKKS